MELRPGRVRQGHGRSWKRRAFTKNLREVGDVLFLRKVVPVWYPSIGARGRNTLPIARQTTRRPAVFAIPGLPHLAVFSVGIDGSVIHNSLLKQLVTGHGSFGDHDSSVIPSSEGAPVASGLAPSPGHPSMPRNDDASACSAKPLGPEPLVSKGLQLQFHYCDRNRILRGCHGHVTLLPSIPGRALDQNHHQPKPTKTNLNQNQTKTKPKPFKTNQNHNHRTDRRRRRRFGRHGVWGGDPS